MRLEPLLAFEKEDVQQECFQENMHTKKIHFGEWNEELSNLVSSIDSIQQGICRLTWCMPPTYGTRRAKNSSCCQGGLPPTGPAFRGKDKKKWKINHV
eukprot:scaffold197569_cov14-Tisochrysis_lutea.AAC.1